MDAFAQKGPGWTWSLYEGGKTVTLAQEIADTTALGAVFECRKGSGQVRVTLYPQGVNRDAEALVATQPSRGSAFDSFRRTGRLTFSGPDQRLTITLPAADLAKLERFVEACG